MRGTTWLMAMGCGLAAAIGPCGTALAQWDSLRDLQRLERNYNESTQSMQDRLDNTQQRQQLQFRLNQMDMQQRQLQNQQLLMPPNPPPVRNLR